MSDFPPIASLRSFEAVARLGSVTLAAKELHVTHSAISQQIKVLEEMVGLKLFIRHGRGVQINEDGRLYALQVREALHHIADATRLVQVKPRRQELTLAMVPSFGSHWLVPRLERFRATYPHISLRIQASLAIASMQQEGIDMAIRMGKGDWEGMESHYLFADELIVVAAPSYNDGVLPQTPSEIAKNKIIFSMESWKTWCINAGLEREIVPGGLCINDSNLVLEAVRLGKGIALERRSLVQDALSRGELVQLTPFTAPYPWPYWLVSPQAAEQKTEAVLFKAWLDEEVAAWGQQTGALEEKHARDGNRSTRPEAG
ncbi:MULTISPECIES: LysR substrate-binding domain-containing protein [Klebsiella]|uniref:LysR substrate-binding domain-containing protein n=1 Tax=Klebsiella pasteurii TaxID=2587529 RepID=A0ABT5CPY7_9ENTR|nr:MULTISPECIES: LysR substrate-binding domain-containing protein [Klebsiella]QQO29886.1 LysR family transcriptional regulator [Klebsiella michiganensis]AYZ19881.1 LysR family transcriptional regulator [Klebsiella sp. FDAARGOS_511]MDC0692955.1 LysR substrate-binding domain-containing protein [Klebsiella pasteurii]MDC0754344.1 LysR substrate-binding domain-containing protein [Klebsiella pasteurii]MDQ2167836.1 LysR substrate-binding domain-containing protein [Klebsiella pasteurii]